MHGPIRVRAARVATRAFVLAVAAVLGVASVSGPSRAEPVLPARSAIAELDAALDDAANGHPLAAILLLDKAIVGGDIDFGFDDDTMVAARLLLSRLLAETGERRRSMDAALEAAFLARQADVADRDIASSALWDAARFLVAAGATARAAEAFDTARRLGGDRLSTAGIRDRLRLLLADPGGPAASDATRSDRDRRAAWYSRLLMREYMSRAREGAAEAAFLRPTVRKAAEILGEGDPYTLVLALYWFGSIAQQRTLAPDEFDRLAAFAKSARAGFGPHGELTMALEYRLRTELARVGRRDVLLELAGARRQLEVEIDLAARPVASRDPGAAFRAERAAQAARSVRRLAMEAKGLPPAALAARDLSRDALVDIAFRAAQLETLNAVSFAMRAARIRAAARRAGVLYSHNWDGQMAAEAQAWRALPDQLRTGKLDDVAATLERIEGLRAMIGVGEAKLAAAIPGFRDLWVPATVGWTDLAADRAVLAPDEAVVLIAPGDDAGSARPAIFVLTVEGVRAATAPWTRAEFGAAIAAYRDSLLGGTDRALQAALRAPVSTPVAASARPLDLEIGHAIYRALFGAPEIAGALAGKTVWTLSVGGPFLSLPFAALPMDAAGQAGTPTASDLRRMRWLGTEKALGFVDSLTDRFGPATGVRDAMAGGGGYVGFGDPDFAGAPGPLRAGAVRGLAPGNVAAVSALPRLPMSAAEVAETAEMFAPSDRSVRLGAEASEAELHYLSASDGLKRLSVLHFATHGLPGTGGDGGFGAALALTPPEIPRDISPEITEDGLLTLREIGLLQLDADWVVLSACDTGAGDRPGTEALTGLARAFLLAGARNVLATHWAVEDEAARRIVSGMLAGTRTGAAPAEALRRALAGLIADASRDASALPLSHPAVWGPVFLFGSGR
ncbi:MAG: CHAT domain-containing protein [Rhodovulum sp.]